ncbi:hypothetical protein [Streptomyces sp. NPDC058683]|uniref:hypothetical protein n=1 Tax=Streptomyces sp. NPDC058683 TaxID=3346597 RepID=UPI003656DBD0
MRAGSAGQLGSAGVLPGTLLLAGGVVAAGAARPAVGAAPGPRRNCETLDGNQLPAAVLTMLRGAIRNREAGRQPSTSRPAVHTHAVRILSRANTGTERCHVMIRSETGHVPGRMR